MATASKSNSAGFYKDLENGKWDDKPSIVLNPLKREKTLKDFKVLGLVAAGLVVFSLWLSDFSKYDLPNAQQQLNSDTIKPEMLNLADSGKTSAILWMASNYPKTDGYRLDALIAQKNSEAMMIKAQILYATDKEQSLKYIQAAAAEGNASAVSYLSEKNPNDIGWTKFVTDYVLK